MTALLVLAGSTLLTGSVAPAAAQDGGGWLGVRLQSLTPHLRESLDLDKDAEGALVAGVVPGSPAEAAGLREGDLIVEIDNREVTSVDEAVDRVRGKDAGDHVLVVVQRDGQRRGLQATLGNRMQADREMAAPRSRGRVDDDVRRLLEERSREAPEARGDRDGDSSDRPGMAPRWKQDDQDQGRDDSLGQGRGWAPRAKDDDEDDDGRGVRVFRFRKDDHRPYRKGMVFELDGHGKHRQFQVAPPDVHFGGGRGGYLGVETMRLGDQLAEYFQAPEGQGVLVTRVAEDSPASEAGIQAGDVILTVDGKDIEDAGDLMRRIRGHDAGDAVEIQVIRKGAKKTLSATLGKAGDLGSLWRPDNDAPLAGVPEPPLPPEPPMAPEPMRQMELHLDRLRDIRGLEKLDLPDIEVDVRGLDDEHLQELRHQLRELHNELRQNLHENLRDLHRQLRESGDSWTEAPGAWSRDRSERDQAERGRAAERARRRAQDSDSGTTIVM